MTQRSATSGMRARLPILDTRPAVQQVRDLIVLANQMGMYSASDWLQARLDPADRVPDTEIIVRVLDPR